MDARRGFIYQPTYRVMAGRPVVHLYGRLESGEPFLVRDQRQAPYFFVEAGQADKARALGASAVHAARELTLEGERVARVEVAEPGDAPPLRQRLGRAGVVCHEADVRFAMRYLIDRGLRGSVAIDGVGRPEAGLGLVFDDAELSPSDWTPEPRVLSFDIETDPQARRILSIALDGCGVTEVLLLTPPGLDCPEGAQPAASEAELLAAFVRRVRELDPDVLTGWNVVDFDLRTLDRACGRAHRPLQIGRGPGGVRFQTGGAYGSETRASVPGRVVLDGIHLLRGAFVRMEEYGLEHVAREVLGHGKVALEGPKVEEIQRLFREDRARLVEYNRTDARLVSEILAKLRLVELAVERSRLTGMPLDRVASSIAAFDALYLARLRPRGVVAPSVSDVAGVLEPQAGGHVLEPQPGIYRNVLVFDFRSLYPSVIRTFGIDPLNLVRGEAPPPDAVVAPSGAAFRRERGILPELLDEIMPLREQAQRAGDGVKAHAIKILMNSFYGVLGTPACRFYDARLANAITSYGREVLLWSKAWMERRGLNVLYGDTDSLFVHSGLAEAEAARERGAEIVSALNAALAEELRRRYRLESRLVLQFDRLYLRLVLPHLRHAASGARKRYAGLAAAAGGPRLVLVGMEAVRGDWTELARRVQRELYERLFADQPVEGYLRGVLGDLRAGRLDDLLVYRKGLRKAPGDYTATTPPHVRAARKMAGQPPRRVAYVITRGGPEPARERRSPLDYDHYVEKQVKPVAEPVLALLGLDFGRVTGEERQLSLF